jgi:hypothetical protein
MRSKREPDAFLEVVVDGRVAVRSRLGQVTARALEYSDAPRAETSLLLPGNVQAYVRLTTPRHRSQATPPVAELHGNVNLPCGDLRAAVRAILAWLTKRATNDNVRRSK